MAGHARWPNVLQAFCRAVDNPANPHLQVRPLAEAPA